MGDVRFLNDRTERIYALDVISELLAKLTRSKANRKPYVPITKEWCDHAKESTTFSRYICSFSETHGSIGLWQRYGANGFGYCIGFHASLIETCLVADNEHTPSFHRIVYQRHEQIREVRECIKYLMPRHADYINFTPTQKDHDETAAAMLWRELEDLALQFKHPDFKDEREWRLIIEDMSDAVLRHVVFVNTGDVVKPFLELSLETSLRTDRPYLPIHSVICGPKLPAELAILGVAQLLNKHGYESLEVSQSTLAATWR